MFVYKGAEYPVPIQGMTPNYQGYYVFTFHIAAKEFANTIGLKFMDGDTVIPFYSGSGAQMPDNTLQYSGQRYAEALTGGDAKPMINALQNYCAYAYLGLSNAGDTQPSFHEPSDVSYVTADTLYPYRTIRSGSVEGLAPSAVSLSLETTTEINLKFQLAEGHAIGEYIFMLDGGAVTPELKGGVYVVTIPNIAAKDLDTMHTLTVTAGGQMLTLDTCALSYCWSVLNYDLLSADMQNTVRALYVYNQEANAYFG